MPDSKRPNGETHFLDEMTPTQLAGPPQLPGRICSWKLDDFDKCDLSCNGRKTSDSLGSDSLLDFSLDILQKSELAVSTPGNAPLFEDDLISQDDRGMESPPLSTETLADVVLDGNLSPSPSPSDYSLSGSSSAYMTSSASDSEMADFETLSPRTVTDVIETPLLQPFDASEAEMLTMMLGGPAIDEFNLEQDQKLEEEGCQYVKKTDRAEHSATEADFAMIQNSNEKSSSCVVKKESRRQKRLARRKRREFAKRQRAKARARAKARTLAKAMAGSSDAESFRMTGASKVCSINIKDDGACQYQNKLQTKVQKPESMMTTLVRLTKPERLDAREASQYYRDKAKNEFNDMVVQNIELRKENVSLRKQLMQAVKDANIQDSSAVNIPPPPKHTDVTSKQARKPSVPYKEGETRRERNRRAAKRSRDNAKKRMATVEAENAALMEDNHALASRLETLGYTLNAFKHSGSDACNRLLLRSQGNNAIAAGANKRRKVTSSRGKNSIGDTGVLSLLLVCGALAIMSCKDSSDSLYRITDESSYSALNAPKMSMSMGRGLQNLKNAEGFPVTACLVCLVSSLVGLLYCLKNTPVVKYCFSSSLDAKESNFLKIGKCDIFKPPSMVRLVSR